MSDEVLEEAFANLLSDMLHTAMEDMKITDDEIAILTFVRDQVEEYKMVLAESMERDPHELDQIVKNALKRLINDVMTLARSDNVISDDEIKLLRDLIIFEDKFPEGVLDSSSDMV